MNTPLRKRSSAVLIRGEEILLVRRKKEKSIYYIFPGGGLKAGEIPEEAIVREVKEEAGITVVAESNFFHIESEADDNVFIICSQVGSEEPVWQEEHKQTPTNSYDFEWVPLSHLASMELVPRAGKDAVIAKYLD
jgi:8-oxo-dGTP diphosphatase